MIQIDGLSATRLKRAIGLGLMPHTASLCTADGGPLALRSVRPPSTPAFQAALLYGKHDVVHGYTWFDRETGRIRRMDVPEDLAHVERQLAAGASQPPLLEGRGRSYMMSFIGGAARALLTVANWMMPSRLHRLGRLLYTVGRGLVRAPLVLGGGIVDMASFVSRERTTSHEWNFLAMRTLNVAFLEEYSTTFAVADMIDEAPIVFLDFISYDEAAHRRGPDHPIALSHLELIDQRIGRLLIAARGHGYDVIAFSDHGQVRTTPFERVTGRSLATLVFESCAPAQPAGVEGVRFRSAAVQLAEARVRSSSVRKWPGALGKLAAARAELAARRAARLLEREHGLPAGELAVVTGGSIAHVYVGREAEGATLAEINARFPRLVPALARSEGIGLLVARRTPQGPQVHYRGQWTPLDDDQAMRKLEPFRMVGPSSLQQLMRAVIHVPTSGDLIAYGAFAPAGAVAFDHEFGSHGGIHPDELDLFVARPCDIDLATVDGGEFDPARLHAVLCDRYAA